MQVSVAVAQIPVCWSVRRNTATVVEIIDQVQAGTVLVLPECALSGLHDQPAARTRDAFRLRAPGAR